MARFEELPTEMMDAIVEYLENSELLPLLSCSSALWSYTLAELDRRENGKDTAMRWACLNGHLSLIHSLISHGASASTIEVEWESKLLTLYLAATKKQVRAFQLLIQLGARIDCPDLDKKAHGKLVDRICDPVDDWALLRLFYKHGLHTQICIFHYPQLERVIRRHGSATPSGPVRMLLDQGISPDERHARYGHIPVTPLATAVRMKNRSTVDLLVRHGAHIDGPNLTHPVRRPWPIPIFVAAEEISKDGFESIQICLKNGADINRCAWERIKGDFCYLIVPDHYLTPFLVYLDSISDWDTQKSKVEPVQAIGFLIDQGARVEQPLNPPIEGRVHDNRLSFTQWGFEFLLRKWGPTALRDYGGFRTTVYFLLQKAVENGTLGESLARYDYPIHTWGRVERNDGVPAIWQDLLTYLLEVQQVDPTTLLYQYILHKGRLTEWPSDIARLTINRLLAAGGNIHARLQPDGPTVLEELCRTYNHHEHGGRQTRRVFDRESYYCRREFVGFLISKGITEGPVSVAHDLLLFDWKKMKGDSIQRIWRLAGTLGKKDERW
ncbi:ankyrin repeat domain-containing protein [Aspergillus affinis]|uniref:ankyrin repeat domain-containing protein n=1 Tax=Aspergillus affinis TaxID=1070780 RepID=UPI0022FDCA43|nr:uncharacterized protein KD926_011285 [Aspergillus affinis]KAI9038150.1 hypothetical protein KD926_011285 [Aspergillus affinis]